MKDISVSEYHSLFQGRIRENLDQLRQIIKNILPDATEIISYKMPAFKQGKVIVYYAGHKNHIGLYPTAKPIIHFAKELSKYKTSKGAIQFPIDQQLPQKLIEKIVRFRSEEVANEMLNKVKLKNEKKTVIRNNKNNLEIIEVAKS